MCLSRSATVSPDANMLATACFVAVAHLKIS